MTARTGRVVVVTGTSTGVGKTVATAALAAAASAAGARVVVVKPVQTGTADGDRDVVEIRRLAEVDVREYVALAEPLAPASAARRAGVGLPRVSAHADRIRALTTAYDVVLVEGAGGLLVRLDTADGTLLDLTAALVPRVRTEMLVVCSPGLGTLNHTELTVDALRARGLPVTGLIIGCWPERPGLAERTNLEDLPRLTRVPILARIPAEAASRAPAEFRADATRQGSGFVRSVLRVEEEAERQ